MGMAESKNVAEAVANVSNFVTNSTTANQSQVNQLVQDVSFTKCVVKGNVNADEVASTVQRNTQIAKAVNNTAINNNIQQQMTQSATSKVGTLGIGYASASNSANQLINDTNSIANSIQTVSNQYDWTQQGFTCNDSYIGGDVNIKFSKDSNFFSDQVLDQTTTNGIVNDIKQSIDQKATATVEGIGSLLLIIAIIIGIILYSVGRTLDTAPVKIAVTAIAVIVSISLLAWNYTGEKPPFFNKPNECIPNSEIGCNAGCTEVKDNQIVLKQPPTKYLFSLPDLAKMVISKVSFNGRNNGDNLGYRMDVYHGIEQALEPINALLANLNIDPVPNPLYPVGVGVYYKIPLEYTQSQSSDLSGICTPGNCKIDIHGTGGRPNCNNGDCCVHAWPISAWGNNDMTMEPKDGIANYNEEDILKYISLKPNPTPQEVDENYKRIFAMRHAYAKMLGLETRVYVADLDVFGYVEDGKEYISFGKDNAGGGSEGASKGKGYRYVSFNIPDIRYIDKLSGGGTLYGQIGYCNDNNYKFQNFMKKIGVWIILLIFIMPIIYMIVNRKKGEKKD
jgi:hypothetical protein